MTSILLVSYRLFLNSDYSVQSNKNMVKQLLSKNLLKVWRLLVNDLSLHLEKEVRLFGQISAKCCAM